MAEIYTYDEAFPTDKDKVRALIPDKADPQNKMLSDQQIALAIEMHDDNLRLATAECCEMIASKLAPDAVSYSIGGVGGDVNSSLGPGYFLRRAKQLREDEAKHVPFFSEGAFDYCADH